MPVSSESATPPHPPPGFVQLLCYSCPPLPRLAPSLLSDSPRPPRLPRSHPSVTPVHGIALPPCSKLTPWVPRDYCLGRYWFFWLAFPYDRIFYGFYSDDFYLLVVGLLVVPLPSAFGQVFALWVRSGSEFSLRSLRRGFPVASCLHVC